MKVKVLRWPFILLLAALLALYFGKRATDIPLNPVTVRLSLTPIDSENYLNDPSFKWLHRQCQPANPFDSGNLEGGWLKSLEKTSSDTVVLGLNEATTWGGGKPLTSLSITNALKKAFQGNEQQVMNVDGYLELKTKKSESEVLEVLQRLIILPNDETPLKNPQDLKCFGKFKNISWSQGGVSITSDAVDLGAASSETHLNQFNKRSVSDGQLSDPAQSQVDPAEKPDFEPVNTIEILFQAQTIKDKTESFASGSVDFVGNVHWSEVSPQSLTTKIRQRTQGDFFVFFAGMDQNGRSRTGKFLAKALNRGELDGIRFSGKTITPNPHIFPKGFSLHEGKPVSALVPQFNFASVAEAKAFALGLKPPLKELKVTSKAYEILPPFLEFLKGRLEVSYKVSLKYTESENDIADDLKSHDLVIVRLKNSGTYIEDFLNQVKVIYPSLQGDLSNFEFILLKKDVSFDQKVDSLQKLEKMLLEKHLIIPIGDVSSGYLISDSIEGAIVETNHLAPLFFSSKKAK